MCIQLIRRHKSYGEKQIKEGSRAGGRGRFTVSLTDEGLTVKVRFEKRFEEASHAYFWEEELSRQRNGKITFLLHFFSSLFCCI